QALNGTYGLPAITERTLSEADAAAARGLYGPRQKAGSIEGRMLSRIGGSLLPAIAAHIWIEDLDSGKVMASGVTSSSGRFTFNSVPAGNYRAMVEYLDPASNKGDALTAAGDRQLGLRGLGFRSVEIRSSLRVSTDKPT